MLRTVGAKQIYRLLDMDQRLFVETLLAKIFAVVPGDDRQVTPSAESRA